ncbi:hypothetical protein [Streptomyces yangpuensis]|uniref:hypothetical protein n=1 Tax=Streptomyces yangpuensis TaxID=1648182 RepID=UPI0036A62885
MVIAGVGPAGERFAAFDVRPVGAGVGPLPEGGGGLRLLVPWISLQAGREWDVAGLLDVDVHELAGFLAFVAAYDVPGRAVEAVAGQDAVELSAATPYGGAEAAGGAFVGP